jgi:MFS family permease
MTPTLRQNLRALPRQAWVLYAGTFINRFGSFVMVFLVTYMTSRGFSPSQAGLALAAYGAGHLVASSVGGHLTDRIGRRPTIAISMFSSALAVLALWQAGQLWLIILLASLTGLAAELYRPASSALLADLTPPEARVTAYSVYRLAINLGFAVGPAVAGLIAQRSFFWLFIVDALTSVIFGVIALVSIVEPPRGVRAAEEKGEFLRTMVRDRRMMLFLAASIAVSCVFFQAESTFPLHVLASGYSRATFGRLISLNGVLIIVFELGLTALTQHLVPQRVIAVGFAMAGLGFALNAIGHTLPLMTLAVVVWSFGEIIASPVAGAYLATMAPEAFRGRYMGAWAMTWSLGLILGPGVGTFLFQHMERALWPLCGVLGLLAAWLVSRSAAGPLSPATDR